MADPIGLAVGAAVAALAGLGLYQKSKGSSTLPGGPGNGSSPGPGPGLAPPVGPGVYPANTPGAFPVQLIIKNSEGDVTLCASPGGCQSGEGAGTIVWYGPGTQVDFYASPPAGWDVFSAFDHFDVSGGITSKQNPLVLKMQGAGAVTAVYAFLGVAPA